MRVYFFYVLLILIPIAGIGQDIKKELDELDTAFARGQYDIAKPLSLRLYGQRSKISNDTLLIEFLNTTGSVHYHLQQYEEAAGFFREAADKAKAALGEHEYHYALAIFNLAGCYKEIGRYAEAEPLYLKSLPVLATAFGQSSIEYTRCFYTLASMYVDMSRFAEAESMCAAAVNFYKTILGDTSDDYLGALGTMGVIYQGLSKYGKAEEIFLALKNYYSALPSPPQARMQTLENNLGELYRHMGEYDKAETFLMNAVKMAGNSLAAAYSLNNLALVQKAKADFSNAESSYKKAIAIYQSLGRIDHPDYTNPVNNLGELYRTMGRLQDAVYAFEEVIEIRKKTLGTSHPNYANALNNLALVEFAIGNYDVAEKHLIECKEIYKKILGEKDKFYANALNNLASVYKEAGKLIQAEETYKECLRIYKEGYGDSSDKYGIYLGGLAGTYRKMKRYNDAIQLTLQSLAILKSRLGVHHYDYIETQYNLAETYREAARFNEAEKHYLESMQGFLNLISKYFPYLSEQDKTSFYYNVANAFETFNSFVFESTQKYPAKDHSLLYGRVYDNQIAIKSLLLKESGKVRNAVAASSKKSVKEDYMNWLQLREQIVQLYRLSSEELANSSLVPAVLEKQANDLEQKITIELDLETAESHEARSWTSIKERLKTNEAAVEIIRTDYYEKGRWTDTILYAALLLTNKMKTPLYVSLWHDEKSETSIINNYRKAIKTKLADEFSYQQLWQPLEKYLAGIQKLYVSADGIYQQVNLNTLKNPRTGKYLLDELELTMVSNTADILSMRRKTNAFTAEIFSFPDFGATTVSVAGSRYPGFPPLTELPGTRAEGDSVKSILRSYKWAVTDHLQKAAGEKELKLISKPAVLHIATHGYFLKNINDNQEKTMGLRSEVLRQNPLLRSGLLLAGASLSLSDSAIRQEENDGIVTAYEAADLNLSGTELVVLSACETGLGELANSQGVYGLQRSFLIAGANAVVMSLWKVDDLATRDLMIEFYRRWLADPAGGKQKALRATQIKLREKYPHPYYWGAFVIMGD